MKTMTLEIDMPMLWPPLDEIRRALAHPAPAAAPPHGPGHAPDRSMAPGIPALPEVLRDLAQTRDALAAWSATDPWNSGDIVVLANDRGVMFGVLLDQQQAGADAESPQGALWRGWLTAPETDWAGPFDVLLEPGDAPFDPVAAVVQTWNPVQVHEAPARRLGRLSAARLATMRAVQDEGAGRAANTAGAIEPRPGFIGLRSAGGFTVLTGTPLAPEGDPRTEYQALYHDAARQLARDNAAATAAVPEAPPEHSLLDSLKAWFSWRGMPLRPAFAGIAVLLLVLVTAPILMPSLPVVSPSGDDIRFRSVEPSTASELGVRWREQADADAVAALLQRISGEVVAGPNEAGLWRIRVPDAALAQRELLASPEVAEVVAE